MTAVPAKLYQRTIASQERRWSLNQEYEKHLHNHRGVLHDPAAGPKLLDWTRGIQGPGSPANQIKFLIRASTNPPHTAKVTPFLRHVN